MWPPPEVVSCLAEIDRPPNPAIRWTTEDQWHVTVRFLGDIGDEVVEGVKTALVEMASVRRLKPLTAVAGPALERLGSSILCVPVAGLDELAASVLAATTGMVPPAGDRPFRGHVTIARSRRGVGFRGGAWSGGLCGAFSLSWVVDEVTLVASTLHPAGARYHVVGRYPLSS